MARPKNSEILAGYKRELSRSKRWRQHSDFDGLWQRMINLYRGRQWDGKSLNDRLVVNMAKATVDVIAPSIAVNNPKIALNARSPEHAETAVIAEEVINYEWRTNHFQDEFREAVRDKLIIGHGWVKVGYHYQSEDAPAIVPDTNDAEVETKGEMIEDLESVVHENIVVNDSPVLERVNPFDVFCDPDASNYKQIRWIAQRTKRPIADAKQDQRYNKKARKNMQATMFSKWEEKREQAAHGDMPDPEKNGYVEIIEMWDVKRGTVSTFWDGATEEFLIPPKKTPFPFSNPFIMLRNYVVPNEFYPMGELEAIETLQQELNETRTQMLNHRKKFSRKWLYRKSAFREDGMSALSSDEDNVMVPVATDEPLDRIVMAMPAAITPPEFYNQSSMIQDDINLVSATSEYTRGSMPDIRRTATEAAMIQDSQNARSADKLAQIESELAIVANHLLRVLQVFLTGQHVIRIVGADGVDNWALYDREFIQGEFDFEVEAGSTQPQNETFRRQSAMQLVDAMAPFADVLNMPELAKHLLQTGFGVKDPDRFIQVLPPMGPEGMPMGGPEAGMMPPQGAIPSGM